MIDVAGHERVLGDDRDGVPALRQDLQAATGQFESTLDGIEEIVAVKGPGFGGPNAVARIRPVTLRASKEVRLSRIDPKSKYDPEIGLLALAVSSREQAAPEVMAALTDLGVFEAPELVVSNGGSSE